MNKDDISETISNESDFEPREISTEELQLILLEHKKWLNSDRKEGMCADLRRANLKIHSLKGCDLSHADLREANLATDFENACLIGANFEDSWACGANFTGANLSKVNLKWSDLTAACFDNANLTEADLQNCNCSGGLFVGASLENANLKKSDLHYAELEGAKLDGAILQEVNLLGVLNHGEENLTIEQLSKTKTLYQAELDEELMEKVKKICPFLLDKL